MPGDVLGSLSRMAEAADQAPQLRGQIPEGGLLNAFKTVIARVEKDPVTVKAADPASGREQTVLFDAWRVRDLAMGYTGRVAARGGMRTWPADVLALYRGDFTRAAQSLLRPGDGYATASFFMLDCASGITPARERKVNADPAAAVLGPINLAYQAGCPTWKIDLGNAFRQNFETRIPTVIVYGTWDVSTPQENALELAPFFKQSTLVKVNGGSHGSLDDAMSASEAFRRAMLKFAATGDASGVPPQVDLPPIEWVAGR
jgi:pimeloyl-ACP methyl ester carboxylesterase